MAGQRRGESGPGKSPGRFRCYSFEFQAWWVLDRCDALKFQAALPGFFLFILYRPIVKRATPWKRKKAQLMVP